MIQNHTTDGDRFTPAPNQYDSVICGICRTQMLVTRDVCGATTSAEAHAKLKHLHDKFVCPHIDENWHIQVKALKKQAIKSVSKQIEDILLQEAELVLATKKETKIVSIFDT
jgi:hypothetical protein